jgi:hypothetical protein
MMGPGQPPPQRSSTKQIDYTKISGICGPCAIVQFSRCGKWRDREDICDKPVRQPLRVAQTQAWQALLRETVPLAGIVPLYHMRRHGNEFQRPAIRLRTEPYSAAMAFCGSGLSSRRRGMTSFAKSVMFATVSLWSRKPPWPNINRWPKPPTLSLSALI